MVWAVEGVKEEKETTPLILRMKQMAILKEAKVVKKAKVAGTVIVILETAHGMIPAIGTGMMRSG